MVSIQEFKQIFIDSNIKEKHCSDRDINLGFVMCCSIQEDETINDNHLRLTYLEFIEALARVSEKLSLQPVGNSDTDVYDIYLLLSDSKF